MFSVLIPCNAMGIDIRKEGTSHHDGTRMPSITKVAADYDNGAISLKISGYTGCVQASVCDSKGNVVSYTVAYVTISGVVTMNIANVNTGYYYLSIDLDNATYSGHFNAY